MENLSFDTLLSLLQTVFALRDEKSLIIFVDLPSQHLPDHPTWKDRRSLAFEWYNELKLNRIRLPYQEVYLVCYENVRSNNNDLPATVFLVERPGKDVHIGAGTPAVLTDLLSSASVVLAPTELSATAPLKLLAKKHGFRGATLPGFTREMIPTLALDYEKITERVLQFKRRMDLASAVSISLRAGATGYESTFDLRFREAHASGGLMREAGVVGNLPSGEAYIVPYEGERAGEPSRSSGLLPVQFQNEVVVYNIVQNKAIAVVSRGPFSDKESLALRDEPAYGNIAEVGIGVLGEWGIAAMGSTLVDEKLGLHVAFGRSDHFGGFTGPGAFKDPGKVVHIDRVYVPTVQPLVSVEEVRFTYPGGKEEQIMQSGSYIV